MGSGRYFVSYKYLLFGGESVDRWVAARGDDYQLHYKMVVLKSISGGCILASVPLYVLSFESSVNGFGNSSAYGNANE